MELMQWSEQFSVGVEEIDKQHQKLFDLINNVIDAVGEKHNEAALVSILEDMVSYIDFHFKYEENLLKDHPEFEKHHQKHADFVKKTLSFAKSFRAGNESLGDDILVFLTGWLTQHILKVDRTYFNDITSK